MSLECRKPPAGPGANILRTVGEERLNNAIECPTSVLHLTGLTTTATGTSKTAAAKK